MNIILPDGVNHIISTLESGGFEAYAVGGCIRDLLMGSKPEDWDICTSALPDDVLKIFSNQHIIQTGLKHGTVTVILGGYSYEVTTFCKDGNYSDNRHPDSVSFVSGLKDDLSRRDFTINSIAYSPANGIIDLYGGYGDIQNGLVRCVGDAKTRFKEDALRILRALRFASILSFNIEQNTSDSIHACKELLKNISAERIAAELCRIITGKGAADILDNYADVFCIFIPELDILLRQPDTRRQVIKAASILPQSVILRLAMLLSVTGYAGAGEDLAPIPEVNRGFRAGTGNDEYPDALTYNASTVLCRLKFDNKTKNCIIMILSHINASVRPERSYIKRLLSVLGEESLRSLLLLIEAGISAGFHLFTSASHDDIHMSTILLDDIISKRECYMLRDLAVDGKDLINCGIAEGKDVGKVLKHLLDMVINDELKNERSTLLNCGIVRNAAITKHQKLV